CGPLRAQAEAAGCVYDLLMGVWVSPQCHDPQLYSQYINKVNSTFYMNRQQETAVSWDDVLSGRHPETGLWTNGAFHHLHCSYIWDRQRRAYARSRASGAPLVLDSHCRNETHTDHCIFWNGNPNPWEIDAPNVTHLYLPEDPVRCLVG
ncbi:hypothetical protein LZ30DRAFT_564132, partial [Colletotrichum cereale]